MLFQLVKPTIRRAFSTIPVLATRDALKIVDAPIVGKKAIASRDLHKGTIINVFKEPNVGHPTMHTIQLDDTRHVEPTLGAECISHACGAEVNTRVVLSEDNQAGVFIVHRDVMEGEDLTFNYNTTEWDMSSPFECRCSRCQEYGSRVVRGFKHLSREEKQEIVTLASPVVKRMALDDAVQQIAMIESAEYTPLSVETVRKGLKVMEASA